MLTSTLSVEELNAHGKRLATSAYKYTRYAMNAVKTAENIGVYALFIPEILTPYNLQVVRFYTEETQRATDIADMSYCFRPPAESFQFFRAVWT